MHPIIRIPEPCHENLEQYGKSGENGRHCLSCAKTVVDFTGWDITAIADYLRNNSEQKGGRVTQHRMSLQENIDKTVLLQRAIDSNIGRWKKFAAIIVIIFALQAASCNRPASIGKAAVPDEQTETMGIIIGEVNIPPDSVCYQAGYINYGVDGRYYCR